MLYESAAQPDGWPVFLESLAGELASIEPALNLTGQERNAGTLWISPGQDEETRWLYDTYYVSRDPRRPKIQETPAGGIFIGSKVFRDSHLVRSEFYNDFLRPRGFFHIMGGVPVKEPDRMAVIRFIRPKRARPFSDRDRKLLGTLMPDLAHALRLHYEFAALRAERDGARDALDRLRRGVVLLSRRGEVVAVNKRARLILEQEDGLFLREGRLRASDLQEQACLERTLGDSDAGDGVASATLRVSRHSGGRPLALRTERLAGGVIDHIAKRAAVAIFIDDPDDHALPSVELVSDALGLTVQQARLVVPLAAGRRLKEIAEELGITYQTARTHLANTRKRTHSHSQKDLVRLVLSLAPGEA